MPSPPVPVLPSSRPGGPQPALGLREAVTLIVGVVVVAGIFKAPALVAGMTGSTGWMLLAWLLGGLVSLAGALCYAELCTAYAHAGGDYHFLYRAYGRAVAFLFGWARYAVITTGSIALLAFVFGDYLQQVLPLASLAPAAGAAVYAGAAVLALALVNLAGLRVANLFQKDLSAATVVTLYLLPNINVRLRPRLWEQLKVGSRVVSHAFDMGTEWPPEQTVEADGRTIYRWTLSAAQKAMAAYAAGAVAITN